jgi:predicted MFS family arabinose efflux permease
MQVERNVKYTNLALEFTVSLVSYIGILGFAAIPTTIMGELSINLEQFAFYNTAFIIVLLVLSLPAGLIADRFGGKRIVLTGILLMALSNISFGVSGSYLEQLISRVTLGVGATFWWIPAPENIVVSFGKAKAAFPLAIWLSGYGTGAAISYPLLVFAASEFGWRQTYVVLGLSGLLLAGLYVLKLRLPAPTVSNKPEDESIGTAGIRRKPLVFPRDRSTWIISLAIFFQYFDWFGILTFFPLFLTVNGFDAVASGNLSFLLVAIGTASMIAAGMIAIRTKKVVPVLLAGLIFLSVSALMPYSFSRFLADPHVIFLLVALIGAGLFVPDVAWTFLSEVLPVSASGSLNFGLVNSVGFIGAILGTFLPPLLLQSGSAWNLVWLLFGAFALISFLVALLLLRQENDWIHTQASLETEKS